MNDNIPEWIRANHPEEVGVRLSLDPYRTLSFYCLRNPPIRQGETSRSERQRPCLRPAFA